MSIDLSAPEVQEAIEAAVAKATDALSAKNRELLGELKTAKAKAKGEIDPSEHAALQQQVEDLTEKLGKAEKTAKGELERLTKALSEKDSALTTHLIDAGLTDSLAKAGVAAPYLDAVKAMLKGQTKLVAENGQYKALLGDKPLVDAVTEWSKSDQGKHFVAAPANSGGGAMGSGGGGQHSKKLSEMTPGDKSAFIREHGLDAFKALVG